MNKQSRLHVSYKWDTGLQWDQYWRLDDSLDQWKFTSRQFWWQKALVYRFLKPHREDFIPQLEPDVKSVNFPPFLVYFLQSWFIFQSISAKFLILTFSFAFLRNSMCDLIGFEPDLLGFIWFFFVFIFWKGLKEDHIFKGWFTNMFRDHLNLFSKPSNFQNLRQIGKELQNCENLA